MYVGAVVNFLGCSIRYVSPTSVCVPPTSVCVSPTSVCVPPTPVCVPPTSVCASTRCNVDTVCSSRSVVGFVLCVWVQLVYYVTESVEG